MTREYSESFIRRALRNEVTWVVTIALGVIGFYKTVVLPINNMQIQIAQVQQQLTNEQTKYISIEAQLKSISDQGIQTATKLDAHLRN